MTRFYRPAARKQLARLAALDALKMAYAQERFATFRRLGVDVARPGFRVGKSR